MDLNRLKKNIVNRDWTSKSKQSNINYIKGKLKQFGLNIPKYYAYFGIFMTLISVILMIVLKSRRPLHDLFADTREVYLESNDYTYYQKKRKKVKRKSGK